jgi:hypothetical protein
MSNHKKISAKAHCKGREKDDIFYILQVLNIDTSMIEEINLIGAMVVANDGCVTKEIRERIPAL